MKKFCISILLTLSFTSFLVGQSPADGTSPKRAAREFAVDGVPWGLTIADGMIYYTVTGKSFNPEELNEDGHIGVIKPGETKPEKITKDGGMKSPKGIVIDRGSLAICDSSYIYMFDPKTGSINGYVNINSDGPLFHLDGAASMGDRIVITCTDKNRIYYADTASRTFAELITNEPLQSPSGVVWDPENKVIYVAECSAVETSKNGKKKPTGRLLAVNPDTGEVTELEGKGLSKRVIRGQFCALALKDGELYFSDFSQDKRPETIRKYNLKTKAITNVATFAMQKVTGLAFEGNTLFAACAGDGKIVAIELPQQAKK